MLQQQPYNFAVASSTGRMEGWPDEAIVFESILSAVLVYGWMFNQDADGR